MATPFTVYAGSNTDLTNALLAPNSGITVSNIALKASGSSAVNFYDGSLLPLGIGAGLLLTSGTTPGTVNDIGWFGQSNGAAGDADINAVVNTVFQTQSYDATTLAFDFVTDKNSTATSITFDLVMGSDEYPEWVNSFVDSAVVIVNGVNYALFNHNANNPLSVVSQNLAAGYFQNNANKSLPIQYDGVSQVLKIVAPINAGGVLNHIKIGVADTGDHIYDTGLFIANLSAGNAPGSGIVVTPSTGTSSDDTFTGSAKDEYFDLKDGNDTVYSGIGDDIVVGGAGNDVVFGGSGDDQIEGDAGNDDIDGGAGLGDTAIYTGIAANYTIAKDASGSFYTVTGKDGSVDTLKNVEIIKFSDGTVNLTPTSAPTSTVGISTAAPETVVVDVVNSIIPTPPVPVTPPNAIGTVFVNGVGSLGQTLTASVTDADGLVDVNGSPVAINYQWQFSTDGEIWSDILGATNQDYTVLDANLPTSGFDAFLQVTANYVDGAGNSEALNSTAKKILETENTGDLVVTLMKLDAPIGASTENPLTTLVQNIIELTGVSANSAAATLKTVLGLPDVNLQSYDAYPILYVTVDGVAKILTDVDENPVLDDKGNQVKEMAADQDSMALRFEQVAVQVAILTSLSDDDSAMKLTSAILNAAQNLQTLDLGNVDDLGTILDVTPLLSLVVDASGNPILDPDTGNEVFKYQQPLNEIFDRNKSMSDAVADNGDVNVIEAEWQDMLSIQDAVASTSISDLSIHINQAPTGSASATTLVAGTEDTAYQISMADLLNGFKDSDGGILAVSELVVDETVGSFVSSNDIYADETYVPGFIFTPTLNYNGPVEFTYTVEDGQYDQYGKQGSIAASQFFVVEAVNDLPTGAVTIIGDTTIKVGDTLNVVNTLSDADGTSNAVLSYKWQSVVGTTKTTLGTGGSYKLTQKDAGAEISVVASYTDDQGTKESVASLSTNTVIPSAAPVNTVPTGSATATLAAGIEDTAYTINATDLLTGFTDVDGDSLSVANLTATNGTLAATATGWTFTSAANYNGSVGLNYDVIDGKGGSIASTQSFSLTAVNDAPVLTGTAATLAAGIEDTAYIINATDLLTGFTDVDGDSLSVANLTATNGTLAATATGWTFTPAANYNGSVGLNYDVIDGKGGSVASTQSFSLTAVNDAPVLTGTAATLAAGIEDTAYTINATDLLTGFTDVDGDSLSVANLTATNGTLAATATGWKFMPAANYNGSVGLNYDVIDGKGGSVASTQSFSLTAINDAPVLTGTAATLAAGIEDTAYTINATDLLTGFTDVDGDSLSVANLTATNGTLAATATGWTFTPAANYNGSVGLNYDVIDGKGGSVASTQSFSLTAVNDAPVLTGTAVTLAAGIEDTAYTINATDLLTGFTDVDGDSLSVANLTTTNGTLAATATGWTFTPAANYNGSVGLNYDVIDGKGGSVASTQSFSLTTVNDAPVVVLSASLSASATEGGASVSLSALSNASDVDNATLSVVYSSLPAGVMYDGMAKSFSFDPKNAAYTSLTAGQVFDVVVNYGISDNIVLTPTPDFVTFKITGIDTVVAPAINVINGTANKDVLTGTSGVDSISGFAGNDTINGDIGNDTIDGGAGIDSLIGGAGNDVFIVDNKSDVVTESSNQGTDTVQSFVTYEIKDNVENLTLTGTSAINGVGNDANNVVTGNSAANELEGGKGNDTLFGGNGNDALKGGAGIDQLSGGAGADKFKFAILSDSKLGSTSDVITDFKNAEGDKVDVSGIDAISGTATINDVFTFITTAFTMHAGELRFENGVLSGDVTGDGVADFEIAMTGVTALVVGSIIL